MPELPGKEQLLLVIFVDKEGGWRFDMKAVLWTPALPLTALGNAYFGDMQTHPPKQKEHHESPRRQGLTLINHYYILRIWHVVGIIFENAQDCFPVLLTAVFPAHSRCWGNICCVNECEDAWMLYCLQTTLWVAYPQPFPHFSLLMISWHDSGSSVFCRGDSWRV